ncbi:MAG: C40 family peptidase [Ginsengibacter sp.]
MSQILFGELCEVIAKNENLWVKIKCDYDGYEGWIPESHLDYDFEINSKEHHLTLNDITILNFDKQNMALPIGANLNLPEKFVSKHHIEFSVNLEAGNHILSPGALLEIAMRYINTTYHWGGKSNFGIDCSGFVQMVFKYFNVKLPRDAYQQAEKGLDIGFLAEAKPGDLAFFDNEAGKITHVGILLNDHEIIHASGKVRIDKIDSSGIINSSSQKRTHKLRMIKRIF